MEMCSQEQECVDRRPQPPRLLCVLILGGATNRSLGLPEVMGNPAYVRFIDGVEVCRSEFVTFRQRYLSFLLLLFYFVIKIKCMLCIYWLSAKIKSSQFIIHSIATTKRVFLVRTMFYFCFLCFLSINMLTHI